MKKMWLLLVLTAVTALPSAARANNLVLDMPPILAPQQKCTGTGSSQCSAGEVCCGSRCVAEANCCGGQYCGGTCCNNQCYDTCVDDSCQPCAAAAGGLNDTGITFGGKYPTDNSSTCAGGAVSTAQDCATGRDGTVNNPADGLAGFSFTKVGSCVKDNVTGLTWSPDQGAATGVNITGKVSNANTNKLCGLTDWHVPTVKELLSIVSYHQISPSVDTDYFTDTISGFYWSKDALASDNNQVWGVSFVYGSTSPQVKSASSQVRLVSGAVVAANFDAAAISGVVIDKNTKLMWKRCLEGYTWNGTTCADSGSAKTFTWKAALDQAAAAGSFAGKTGWRLPNIKELQSIVDETKSSPVIDIAKFPNVPPVTSTEKVEVWSSSPYAVIAGGNWKSWRVAFASGQVNAPLSRESTLYVRFVRDCTSTDTECN